MYWLLLLPLTVAFFLTFGVFYLAFVFVRLALKILLAFLLLPIVATVALAAALVGGIALLVIALIPLLPALFLAFCVWALIKLSARPVASLG